MQICDINLAHAHTCNLMHCSVDKGSDLLPPISCISLIIYVLVKVLLLLLLFLSYLDLIGNFSNAF